MPNVGISDTTTSQFNTNITTPGPTGVVGDMKNNPSANPNISQNDVTSTRHSSMEATDSTNASTKAYENEQELTETTSENSDPEVIKAIAKAVISHDSSVKLDSPSANANQPVSSAYGN